MKYRICTAEQGTPEWLQDRLGCVTGSKADILYATGKGGAESTQRVNDRYELAEERVTGIVTPQGFMSEAMRWGTEQEPFARMTYEGMTGLDVRQCGFIRLDGMFAGCSIDGAVMAGGEIEGIQEFKCPMLKTHIGYLKAGILPTEYRSQVIHNLWCTGAQWLDFASYRPGFRMFLIRVYAKDLPIEEHAAKVEKFLAEVAECEAEIRTFADERD